MEILCPDVVFGKIVGEDGGGRESGGERGGELINPGGYTRSTAAIGVFARRLDTQFFNNAVARPFRSDFVFLRGNRWSSATSNFILTRATS